jgi:hypothetical protein
MEKRMPFRVHKRPVLLLEVMIALALIVMAAIPLIYPHIYLLRTQRQFIEKVELDHVVNQHYVDVLERLYLNEISWAAILNQLEFRIEDDLQRIQYDGNLPYRGVYRFRVGPFKPKTEGSMLTLYLINLDYAFYPLRESPTEQNVLTYHYDLFVVRDLTQGGLPEGSEQDIEETPEEEAREI